MKKTHPLTDENYNKHTKLSGVLWMIICFFFIIVFLSDKILAISEYDSFDFSPALNADERLYLESEYINSLPFAGKIIIHPIYVYNGDINEYEDAVYTLLRTQLEKANEIFSQIGITIEALDMVSMPEIDVDGFEKGEFDDARKTDVKSIEHLNQYIFPLTVDAVPVFFVEDLGSSWLTQTPGQTFTKWRLSKANGTIKQAGCFIAYKYSVNSDTLAHELGHFMLNDRFFYLSACIDDDGTRHHLKLNHYLMHPGTHGSSIIDFLPMIKEGYMHNTSPHDIKSMRDSRVNQIEAIYTRSGIVTYTKTVESEDVDKLRILMPNYSISDNNEKQININTRNTSVPRPPFNIPHYIDITWGGNRQTDIALSEYQGIDFERDVITNIQISSWARITSTKVEYCIDIYFEEPFNYFPYYDGQPMVPDAYGNEPYFILVMSTKFDLYPEAEAVQVYTYLQNKEDKTIYTEELETELKIKSSFSAEQQNFHNIFWIKINLADMQEITHLRWTWQ
ncbi:hypothetical protein ACFL3Q_06035 [Planctomycetota bacterium]